MEFAPDELTDVCRAIDEAYAERRVDQCATYQRWTFGGETFLFENEWDEPCLIAQSAQGVVMLREIAESFVNK